MGENGVSVNKNWTEEQIQAVVYYRCLEMAIKALIRAKRDETDDGEELRGIMDKVWRRLPGDEIKRLNKNIQLPKVP